jgi:hypothetical protein
MGRPPAAPPLWCRLVLLCAWALVHPPGTAAEAGDSPLVIEFQPRTAEQITAFYAARGFPARMVELLSQQCFITVRIHNTGSDVVWLELANWHFSSNGVPITREHRDHWMARWQKMGIPLASQSTFRWTLLPESLDFQPKEREGGNIILPPTAGPVSLRTDFATGQDKRGPMIRLRFDQLHCGEDQR